MYGGIAQLVRVLARQARGRWFESSCLHHDRSRNRNSIEDFGISMVIGAFFVFFWILKSA